MWAARLPTCTTLRWMSQTTSHWFLPLSHWPCNSRAIERSSTQIALIAYRLRMIFCLNSVMIDHLATCFCLFRKHPAKAATCFLYFSQIIENSWSKSFILRITVHQTYPVPLQQYPRADYLQESRGALGTDYINEVFVCKP